MPVVVAVDAMGGDHAPAQVVLGAVQAARDPNVEVVLVGQEDKIRAELPRANEQPARVRVVSASEVVEMHESASTAIRRKRDCSMRVAAGLVRSAEAQAFVSAGNSGAAMAAAMFELGTLPGVDRAAIAAVMPNLRGKTLLLDAGANVDCTPEMLAQFAAMGTAYVEKVFDMASPRIGLLNIGEEKSKGNALTKAAYSLLESSFPNFVGNVEGNEFFKGAADVVVCDGFSGNLALKYAEGAAEFIMGTLKEQVARSPVAKLGALVMRPQFRALKRVSDYAEYGGAPLLGVGGVCIIGHGRSNARAIANAIKLAAQAAIHDLVPTIQARVAMLGGVPSCR